MIMIIGALTNKAYAFKNRPWELHYINSIDIFDSLGSSIRFYLYGSEIRRVLPLKNDLINEDWISNKSRYLFEGLYKWRVNIPLMRKLNSLIYISWLQGFYFLLLKIWYYSIFFKTKTLALILNFVIDSELLITTKLLASLMGITFFQTNKINYLNDFYLFYTNPFFFDEIKKKKIFLFLGINLRLEAPILNIKLRKNFFKEDIIYCTIGSTFNDNLNSISLGLNIKNINLLLKGKLKFNIILTRLIKKYNNLNDVLMCFLGNNILCQKNNKNIYFLFLNNIKNINLFNLKLNLNNKKYIVFNYLNKFFNFQIKKEKLNLVTNVIFLNLFFFLYKEFLIENINDEKNIKNFDMIYILNGNFFLKKKKNKFIIFQGHHIDINLNNLDLILPNTTFLEKSSNFLTLTGNFIKTNKILSKPNFTRNDWMIFNAIYLYSLTFLNKIYKFFFRKVKITFLNSNRFYLLINAKNDLILYVKKFSIKYYYKEVSKYNFYDNNLIKNIFLKKNISVKIYNKIIMNYFYNIYDLNIIDKNSKTLKLSSFNYKENLRNYVNIK